MLLKYLKLINLNLKYLNNFNKYKIMKYNFMFREKSKKEIPFHEKYETIDFTPKKKKQFKNCFLKLFKIKII